VPELQPGGVQRLALEQYVEEHSELLISHGLCPSCLERWQPELFPWPMPRMAEVPSGSQLPAVEYSE